MNGYVCFYNGRRIEVRASGLWEAKQKAVKQFNVSPRNESKVSVTLAEKDGKTVTHRADF